MSATTEADARLIAAGQDMLRLLKEAVQNAQRIGTTGAWLLEALQVIAVVEGRADAPSS